MPLQSQLTVLETSGLIRLAQMEPELEYLFRHALIQDAVYESLLKADRRILHRVIGETLEHLYPERLSELAPTLARHFHEAGELSQALHYFMRAGDLALANYANAEAEQHYRLAQRLATAGIDQARALFGLGNALFGQVRFAEAVLTYREAIGLFQVLGDYDTVARLYTRASFSLWQSGAIAEGLAVCREGLAALAGQPETRSLAAFLHEAGRACHFNGLPVEARQLCEQALRIAERLNLVRVQVEAMATLGNLLDQSHASRVQILTRATELAEAAGVSTLRARNNLANTLEEAGDFRAGLRLHRQAMADSRQRGSLAGEIHALTQLGFDHLMLGEIGAADEVDAKLNRLLSDAASSGVSRVYILSQLIKALLARSRGALAEAGPIIELAREAAQRGGDIETLTLATLILAEISLENGALEIAVRILPEAVVLTDRGVIAGVDVWARCLLSLAHLQRGDIHAAHTWFAEARFKREAYPTPLAQARLTLNEARLASAEAKWPEAFAAFELTAQLEARMGRRWYRAQTLREWAEAHLSRVESGDVDRARQLLREAQLEFEAMNVPIYAALVIGRLQEL